MYSVLCCFSRVWLFATPWTIAHQDPLSMEFSRQEYWIGMPCTSPGDLPDSGIKPALSADCLPSEPPGKPQGCISQKKKTKSLKCRVCTRGISLFCNHSRLYGGKLPQKFSVLGSIFDSRRTDSREFVFISQKTHTFGISLNYYAFL